MASINRRSTFALGLGAASLLVLRTPRAEAAVGEEKELAKGGKQRILGEGPSLIPGYKKVSMRDVIFEPGAAWLVYFSAGEKDRWGKKDSYFVRAVRGGL